MSKDKVYKVYIEVPATAGIPITVTASDPSQALLKANSLRTSPKAGLTPKEHYSIRLHDELGYTYEIEEEIIN